MPSGVLSWLQFVSTLHKEALCTGSAATCASRLSSAASADQYNDSSLARIRCIRDPTQRSNEPVGMLRMLPAPVGAVNDGTAQRPNHLFWTMLLYVKLSTRSCFSTIFLEGLAVTSFERFRPKDCTIYAFWCLARLFITPTGAFVASGFLNRQPSRQRSRTKLESKFPANHLIEMSCTSMVNR